MSLRFEEVLRVFRDVVSLPPEQQPSQIEILCRGDRALQNEIEAMVAMKSGPSILDHPPEFAQFETGDTLATRFRIVGLLGKGGMGCVYEAEDLLTNTRVALKTVLPKYAAQPGYRKRFLREIKINQALGHQGICQVRYTGAHPAPSDGNWTDLPPESALFLAMDLVQGVTLTQWIQTNGPFSAAQALPIADQLVDALDAAHRNGIVHRDLKSGNIMLVDEGPDQPLRVVIMDFGLAHIAESSDDARSSVQTGPNEVVGTRDYMAPEQFYGDATVRSDIYALGVVLYEMLTGVVPLADNPDKPAFLRRMVEQIPPPGAAAAGVPAIWNKVILRCLHTKPDDRFATVRDVGRALHGRVPRKKPMWIGGAVAVLLIAVLSLFYLRSRSSITRLTDDNVANDLYLSAKEKFDQRASGSVEDVQEVIRLYDQAILREPRFAAALARRGYAKLWMSRLGQSKDGSWQEKAQQDISKGEEIAPDLFEVHLMKGSILTDIGRTDQARKELERAIQLQPKSDEAYKKLSTLYMNQGEYSKALSAAEKAAAAGPYSFDNFVSVGYAAMRLCLVDKAEAAYTKVTELEPKRATGWNGLGSVLIAKGEFERSIPVFQKALEKADKPAAKATAYSNIATARYYMGAYDEAAADASLALHFKPGKYSLNGNLADAYLAKHDMTNAAIYYEQAIAGANAALRLNANDADAIVSLALYYARTGKASEARKQLSAAQSPIDKRPDLAYTAAIVHAIVNERAAALSRLKAARESCMAPLKMASKEPELAGIAQDQSLTSLVRAR